MPCRAAAQSGPFGCGPWVVANDITGALSLRSLYCGRESEAEEAEGGRGKSEEVRVRTSTGRRDGADGRNDEEMSVIVGPYPSLGAMEGDRGETTVSGVSIEAYRCTMGNASKYMH